jgi:hypothetical protein
MAATIAALVNKKKTQRKPRESGKLAEKLRRPAIAVNDSTSLGPK